MISSIKLFWKKDCVKCPAAKKVFTEIQECGIRCEEFDVDTVNGLAESAFYSVQSTPTIIIIDALCGEIASWRGFAPSADEIKLAIDRH